MDGTYRYMCRMRMVEGEKLETTMQLSRFLERNIIKYEQKGRSGMQQINMSHIHY